MRMRANCVVFCLLSLLILIILHSLCFLICVLNRHFQQAIISFLKQKIFLNKQLCLKLKSRLKI